MGLSCCVTNCKNITANSSCKFYRFPSASYKKEQKNKWILAVRKINSGGSAWCPSAHDRICSDHFIGKKKSDVEISPSHVPTIFSCTRKSNEIAIVKRHERFLSRRFTKEKVTNTNIPEKNQVPMETEDECLGIFEAVSQRKTFFDQECQVDMYLPPKDQGKTFVCNKYVTVTTDSATNKLTITNEVEIQTDIMLTPVIIIPSQKKVKNKECITVNPEYVDKAINVNSEDLRVKISYFQGYDSVKKKEQLLDLAGVSFETFDSLLSRIPEDTSDSCKISTKNRLLILLMKLKTGLMFSAISALFSVHRTTVSRIFVNTLQYLASSTTNFIFWPSKKVIQATMPKSFLHHYQNIRVILDCTEFKIDAPSGVDKRVFSYSHYKKGYTAKVLIGITPGGFISFKSRVSGGRKSDSQITIESGLIDLLEEGDVVLADKGFPEIRKTIDDTGKSVFLVMTPFLQDKKELSKEETEETYKIASVRIHVERIMARLKIYHILNKIPANLFPYVDDIVHLCCVLVNLQPPIYAQENDEE